MPFDGTLPEIILVLSAAYIVITLVAIVLLLVIVYRLTRWVIRGLMSLGLRGSGSAVIQVSAFAISLWMFPELFRYLFQVVPRFITRVLDFVPNAMAVGLYDVAELCERTQASTCIREFLTRTASSAVALVTTSLDTLRLETFPFTATVFLLASWIVLARVADAALRPTPGAGTWGLSMAGARGFLRSVKGTTWKNLALFAVLAVASYLSFVSIAAIPSLQDEGVTDSVTDATLKTSLEKAQVKGASLSALYPDMQSAESALADLRTFIEQKEFTAPRVKAILLSTITQLESSRAQINELWAARLANAGAQQDALLSVAVDKFQLDNKERKGKREAIDHYEDIINWYHWTIRELKNELGRCYAIRRQFEGTVAWYATSTKRAITPLKPEPRPIALASQDLRQTMETPPPQPPADPSPGSANPDGLLYTANLADLRPDFVLDQGREATFECTQRDLNVYPPDRGQLGAALGPFSTVMNWLLRTESLPLTLIVGLLGFGLLGATCSTFVRESTKRPRDTALVEDLAGAIIRGGSAAVVVFLGVYGGLAIFVSPDSAQEVRPNPYAVLFAVLVAAVFSDDVWAWARTRLNQQLGGRRDSEGNGGTAGGAAQEADDGQGPDRPPQA